MNRLSNMLSGKNEKMYDLIIAVVGRGFSDYVVSAARDAGATGATIIYGRGTSDYDKQVMGISLQPERELVLVLVKNEMRRKIMKEIVDKTSVIEEGRGICFSLPVTQVYGLTRAEKDKDKQIKKAEELRKSLETESLDNKEVETNSSAKIIKKTKTTKNSKVTKDESKKK